MTLDPAAAYRGPVAKAEPFEPVRVRPRPLLGPSTAFDLDRWDLDPADKLDMWANTLEGMAIVTRLARKSMTQARTVAGVTTLIPPMCEKPIHELGDRDLETLVKRLRDAADAKRQDIADSSD